MLGHAPLSAAPLSALAGPAARHVVVETALPATVRERSDAVYLRVDVTNPGGGVVDLTDAAAVVAVLLSPAGGRTEVAAQVVDAAAGRVRVETPRAYLTAAGRWKVQVVVTFSDGGALYTPPQKIKAKPNL